MADAPLDQVEAFKAYILARYPLSAPALLRSIELKDARIAELVAANEMLSRSLDESLFCNVQGIAESLAAQPQPPAAPLTPPGLDIRFHLVADQMPELIEHSTSYGGRWSSKWCICLKPDGTAEVNRWTVTNEVKGALDQRRKPFAPWTTSRTANPFFTPYLAWAYVDDVAALLAPITTHKDAP